MAKDKTGIKGRLRILLTGPDGEVKIDREVPNLITTAGDQYYARMACAGIGGNTSPTFVDGMKLGTATTAVAKASTGSFIASGNYITASNNALEFVEVEAVPGTDAGWRVIYTCSWGAGDATATIQEVALVTDQETNNTTTGASVCVARALTGTISKAAGDTLTLAWTHAFLGA